MVETARTLVSLPLFPLATVLYPGASLSLRVFELRYLDMVRKCHVQQLQQLQPGLLQVQGAGSQRFRTTRTERRSNGLWMADVVLLQAPPPVALPEDLRPCALALERALQQIQARQPSACSPAGNDSWQLDDCQWVANRWCELLPLPLAQKQLLLELDSPLLRLELVWDYLQQSGIGVQP